MHKMKFFVITWLLLSIICLGSSIDIIGHNIVCSGDNNQRNIIPGTNLKTGKFYTLRLKRFLSNGVITWTNQCRSSGARFVQTDNGASQNYDKDGKWEYDAQWVFIQSVVHPEWYELINRGIPGEYFSFSTNNNGELSHNKFHALLNPNYHPKYTSNHFLWKPVLQRDAENGNEFYQLKSKAIPDAVVTWSEKKYLQNGQYIQVDNSRDVKYNQGNEWFDDTLFSFQSVEGDEIRIKASVFRFKLNDKYPENLEGQVNEQVDLIPYNQTIFRNNDSIPVTRNYKAGGQITERVVIENPKYLEKFDIISIEKFVELESQATIPFLVSSFIKKSLITAHSNSSLNYTEQFMAEKQKELNASHQVEILPCMEYIVSSTVKYVKNYPVDFIFQVKITGNDGGIKVKESLLRVKHIPEGMEYIESLDDYTVIAQGRGKMRVDFVDGTPVSGFGVPLQECSRKYDCLPSMPSAYA